MNRRYDKEKYLDLVDRIRTAIPDISLTTDIIVGFPGETEEDFQDTLDVVEKCDFDSAFTFIYSKRTGTPAAAKEDQVPAALDAMRLFKMRGCNVTMPCKNKVAQCVDELSPAAKIIGAVNTIVNEDGKLVGHITDGIGFVRNLKEHGVDVKGKKMVVLGAGGAATALTVQCALDGAASIAIFNPDDPFLDRAKGTAEKLAKEVPDCK